MRESFTRGVDIFNVDNHKNVVIDIIGLGSSGSNFLYGACSLGLTNFRLFDGDKVEINNVSHQFFRHEDIGEYKVDAIKDNIYKFYPKDKYNINIETNKRYIYSDEDPNFFSKIIFCAVDSMAVRKYIFEIFKDSIVSEFFIDARMGGENIMILSTNHYSEYLKAYEKSLYTDEEAADVPCGAKSVCYNAVILGNLVTYVLKQYLKNQIITKSLFFNYKGYQIFDNSDIDGDI